jgi:hypothetical protein
MRLSFGRLPYRTLSSRACMFGTMLMDAMFRTALLMETQHARRRKEASTPCRHDAATLGMLSHHILPHISWLSVDPVRCSFQAWIVSAASCSV